MIDQIAQVHDQGLFWTGSDLWTSDREPPKQEIKTSTGNSF